MYPLAFSVAADCLVKHIVPQNMYFKNLRSYTFYIFLLYFLVTFKISYSFRS